MSTPFLEHQPDPVNFLNLHSIDWPRVRSTQALIHQRFQYDYPGPVHELRHRLVVVPADRHGQQQLSDYHLQVSLPPLSQHGALDPFGNRFFEFYIPHVETSVAFEVWFKVEQQMQGAAKPLVPAAQMAYYLQPTRLTAVNHALATTANELRRQHPDPRQLAERITAWTYQAMRYRRGMTTVETPAVEALALGAGLCQDYAHIMLALCRAAGLPARYVSGHLFGEGGSHAWVEVLLPHEPSGDFMALPFDPTNHCQAMHKYITIAVGRDYADVTPTSGSFIASYSGRLTSSKRAGLTVVEYTDGRVICS
jgi:transglutaminase-like putative cysteine protease